MPATPLSAASGFITSSHPETPPSPLEMTAIVCQYLSVAFVTDRDKKPRLVNGSSRCAGRVELFSDGQWHTVCGAAWNNHTADNMCKELGCGFALSVSGDAQFGEGSGPVIGQSGCGHETDAGVLCSESVELRLVNGGSRCAGRVELFSDGQWHTVCGAAWNIHTADNMCKELGCGSALSVSGDAQFGEGSGPVIGQSGCGHETDAGVLCSESVELRLVNGGSRCAGRVELFSDGQWHTVCGAAWNIHTADNMCKELGCGSALSVSGDAQFGEGSGPVIGQSGCGHETDGGVLCSAGDHRA
ncbi:deleted in malignant brain tumors 1 protein-like [Callorhinchus milii]|uniref:deleted in malignant brain tumors 1 protein-like n=1 Tax=Callorhinchus milii TaxID=7868 RepID=UPI001C3F54C2|nr:deleted in malignant brain tumors 1 protein-like [Callorhinchus milii]